MSQDLQKFNELRSAVASFVAPTQEIQVSDPQSAQSAMDTVKTVKHYANEIEKLRKSLVEPLNTRVKEINAYAREVASPLDEAEAHIKRELARFEDAQERIRQEAIRKAEDERRRQAEELAKRQAEERARAAAEIASNPVVEEENPFGAASVADLDERQAEEKRALEVTHVQAVWDIEQNRVKGAKKLWKCEAVDLTKVPREFLVISLNEKAVLAMARAGVTEIPGVRLWQETSISVGANSYIPKALMKG
jgi:DNA polymerase III alpha subunit (gram-positive type)